MAQKPQIVDITKSYLPGDPNAFVQNLINTDREDGEERTLPIVAFEGYNFLPTAYGYRSYFGLNNSVDIAALTSRPQFVLLYQLPNYQSRLIALCEDGIWTNNPMIENSTWTQEVTFYLDGTEPDPSDPVYDVLVFEEWTWCVLENVLYMYQQGRASAWKTAIVTDELAIQTHTPSFLNMSGQMGIFKAGTRLGFWDSANSVSWCSNFDLTDFTPSLENMSGNTIFSDVVGRIVTIKQQDTGFIIYCTKSIVGVTFDATGNLLWDSKRILSDTGISYSRAVAYGQSDGEHIAYTSSGIYTIGKYSVLDRKHAIQPIATDLYDFLKETRDPVYVDMINSRFVFFSIMNSEYVYGKTIFTPVPAEDLRFQFTIGGENWNGETLPAVELNCVQAANAFKQLVTFGFVSSYDTSALWTVLATITQPDTDGPLGPGATYDPLWHTKTPETPRFTTQDIVNSYISGTTLPDELDPTPIESPKDGGDIHLGNIPQGAVTITGAAPQAVTKWTYLQYADWAAFKQHQTAAFAAIAAATKATTTAGVTIVGYTYSGYSTQPTLPATSYVDTVVGTYRTGAGNTELQLDAPLRKLVIRKYWQQGLTITRRVTTSYVNRSGTPVSGYVRAGTTTLNAINDPPIGSFSFTGSAGGLTETEVRNAIAAQLLAAAPAGFTKSGTPYTKSAIVWGASELAQITYDPGGVLFYYTNNFLPPSVATVTPWYRDSVDTITYIIGTPTTQDMGYDDFSLTQIAYGKSTVQVTSDPPTIVVHSPIPIFPTGESAINFFPPAWEGEETLTLIGASAYSPWHPVDGTFGIEAIEEPLTGAAGYPEGETCAIDSDPMILTDYGTTYSGVPYLLQLGSGNPLYPMFEGAYVLDLQYKKWGKMKNVFRVLMSLEAVNIANYEVLLQNNKGMDGALMSYDGLVKPFDDLPSDSVIRYGKLGYYRLGMTDALEVKVQMRDDKTGSLLLSVSMDGRELDLTRSYTLAFTDSVLVEGFPDIVGRWFVVSISGNYDLTGLEFRGKLSGRR